MAIKKASKVNAEFSMSSLTDIIFLLLIFFMLTSSFVSPNALKLVLPKATNAALAKQTLKLYIDKNLNYKLEDESDRIDITKDNIESILKNKLAGKDDFDATIVINADESVPIKEITAIMAIGNRIKQKVILATQPE